jgi:5'-3' exoribonuclease 2
VKKEEDVVMVDAEQTSPTGGLKRKLEDVETTGDDESDLKKEESTKTTTPAVGEVGDAEEEFEDDAEDDDEEDTPQLTLSEDASPEVAKVFKDRVKNKQQKKLDDYANAVDDKVRLHESGWKDRYYSDKCKADDVAAHGGREHLFRSYVMGLCWVMKYYYDGCKQNILYANDPFDYASHYCLLLNPLGPSWKWYYPFHYAPFASDLRNIERFQKDVKEFELSTPFNPVEQLMSVLPSDSSHAIPKAPRWLMSDPESPIIDFYPKDVPVDPNGKAMPWLWVVLLPFIEEERLLAAL